MARILIGVFLILHGLVHLLYFALSRKLVTLDRPIADWPLRSWVFANLLSESTTRLVASGLYLLATVLFVISGLSILLRADWWNPFVVGAGVFSSVVVFLFWDGKFQQMPDKGFVGVLINLVILAAAFLMTRYAVAL
ncbi:MAG: hypothetical protein K8J31_27050 [Anaerolineae bacterium]|nr:hypothetical protein [Anaerolineae bacterium]